MKIMFVMHNCDRYSGANLAMHEVIDDLVDKYGVEPIILYPNQRNDSAKNYSETKGIKCLTAKYWSQLLSETDSKLKNIVKMPLLMYRQLIMLNTVKVLKLVVQDVDLIYTNTSTVKIGLMLAMKYNKPHVWHIREFADRDHRLVFPFGEKCYFNVSSKLKCRNEVIVISQCLYNSRYRYFGQEKTHLVYDDVAPCYINPEKVRINNDVNILIAGDIKAGKGQMVAVQAIRKLMENGYHNVHLYIAGKTGDVEYEQSIDQYVEKYSLSDNVHFLGRVDNMNELRRNMDIAVVASISEAFGRVTVEGMLSKMAVIGRDAGATPEIIEDGVTGLLYDGSAENLAEKIIKLLDKDKRKEIAEASYTFAVQEYTTKKCCDRVWSVIKAVL